MPHQATDISSVLQPFEARGCGGCIELAQPLAGPDRMIDPAIGGPWVSGRLSIIIPVYNRASILREALASIGWQTYRDLEVIVVDDGSDDLCPESFAADFLPHCPQGTRYIRQENRGVAAARNTGIYSSTGEYLYFLDSDDLLVPDSLGALVEGLAQSGRDYCLGRVLATDFSVRKVVEEMRQDVSADVFNISGWCSHGALYKRDAVITIGGFDQKLRVGEDTIFQLQIKLASGAGEAIDSLVAVRRLHTNPHLNTSWQPGDQARYLTALAHVVAHGEAFRIAPRMSRLKFVKAFILRAAVASRSDHPAAQHAMARVTNLMLEDMPLVSAAVRLISQSGTPFGLVLTAKFLRLLRSPLTLYQVPVNAITPADRRALQAIQSNLQRADRQG